MLEKLSRFLSSDQPSEPRSLDVVLNIAGVEKYARKTLRSTLRPFDLSFERKGALVTVEICVFCGRWFSNQFEIVSETPFSCDTIGRELLWAVLCSLLCRETDWNIHIGNQGFRCVYFMYLTLRSGVLMFRIPNINRCVKNFLRLRKVEFIKLINLKRFVYWVLLSNGSRLTKNNFVFGLVSLDSRLLENFFRAIF